MGSSYSHFYDFGPFRLDQKKHRLLRGGEVVPLSPKAIEVLVVLVRNSGRLLERKQLLDAVWEETFVEDANLTVQISALRKALGETAETANYIATAHGEGYRFVADVHEVREEIAPLIIEKRTLSKTTIEEEIVQDEEEYEGVVKSSAKLLPLPAARRATRLFLAMTLFSAFALGAVLYVNRERPRAESANAVTIASLKSIAVLPPRTLSGETDAPLSLGLADALITRLGSVRKLPVRPTSSIIRYAEGNPDPVAAGRALGVDAVLEGTLQRDARGVRVTLRLVNVINGMQLWSGHVDEKTGDIFRLQDAVSQQVADALFPHLSQSDQALLIRAQTANGEAYANFLKGNYYWSKRGDDVAKGRPYLLKAIEQDPNYAEAYAVLAAMNATNASTPEAENLAEKALRLDNSLASAHATYGFIRMFHHWDWTTAEKELDRALELDPNSATAHHWKGVYLSLRGRLDEAKLEMHRALEADPLSLIVLADLGQLHYFAKEYDQAINYCNQAVALDSNFYKAHEYLIDIYWATGRKEDAARAWTKVWFKNQPDVPGELRSSFRRSGMRAFVQYELDLDLRNNESQQRVRALAIARNHLRLGHNEEGLRWLEVAFADSPTFLHSYLNVDPLYDAVRSHPRFQALIRKMNLA